MNAEKTDLEKVNDWMIAVDFSCHLTEEDGDYSDYILVYEGKVAIYDSDEDSWSSIGTITVHLIQLSRAINDSASLFDIMDSLTQDTFNSFEVLFDSRTHELRRKVANLISEDRAIGSEFMLIDRLELNPSYRGLGLGKRAVHTTIKKLGADCQAIACFPAPLQFLHVEPNASERTKALRKVRLFWQQVGFVRVPGTGYYIWPD